MCINIDDIHKTIIIVVSKQRNTCDDDGVKDQHLAPNEISNNNNFID